MEISVPASKVSPRDRKAISAATLRCMSRVLQALAIDVAPQGEPLGIGNLVRGDHDRPDGCETVQRL